MNFVSLVCTVHEEMGSANATELHAILQRILPQVIFLEVPPSAFDSFYETCGRENLESRAVRQYRESQKVELVPVDLPTPEREFFENIGHLNARVREASPEYRQMMNRDAAYVKAYGFAYLNSEYSSKLWCNAYEEMLSTIRRLGDSRLMEIYESWKETLDHRESVMLKNITSYCGERTFDKGVFLVGAAHRQPIIDKSVEQATVGSTRVRWDFPAL